MASAQESPNIKPQKREEYKPTVSILSYGAGNIRSLVNAIEQIGFETKFVQSPAEIEKAEVLVYESTARVSSLISLGPTVSRSRELWACLLFVA